MSMFAEMLWLLLIDVLFVGVLVALLVALGSFNRVAFAVLKRNFVGYFSSPTGYAFICMFVLLTSTFAFWPADFFNSNLANFDQLNKSLPFIMLIFIPAITMSIWAEERRQGTDELLLTLPATDFDIVIGKYLAAASIFTVSLLFSQLCNYAVLVFLSLGDLDTGLLFSTYLGYWLMGLAMLALGMVASFFTSNLTVGFLLGALVNVPLAFAAHAKLIVARESLARMVSEWSLTRQSEDFGRGVLSLAGVAYFVMIAVVGVYLSMVLIGRRHWSGGRDGQSMLGHYLVRVLSLVAIVVGANVVFANFGSRGRIDLTEGGVNWLSKDTRRIVRELNAKHVVQIDAYVGANIPEDYVKTRFELISKLREFQAMSGGKVKVNIFDNLEPFSDEAVQAERRFGIRPRPIRTRTQGVFKDEQVILGAGFTCGLEKVVVPFFDYGIPVEYELIRSISTVAKGQRKKLGVVRTDAQMMGGFEFNGMQPSNLPKQAIVEELEKQYDVELVEPNAPIDVGKYDVMLVVQPSSLGPQELPNLVDAIKKGVPFAIFEDPMPVMLRAPGTDQPKQQNPMASMFGGGGPPPPKGDISQLWKAIGVQPNRDKEGPGQSRVVWQQFNPYKKVQVSGFGPEFVFVRHDAPDADRPFNPEDAITSGLEEILFPFPGAVSADPDVKDLKFTTLVQTPSIAGTLSPQEIQMHRDDPFALEMKRGEGNSKFTLAARIQGVASGDAKKDEKKDGEKKEDAAKPLNVVYIADIDLISSEFVRIREQPDQEFQWRFENVTFVLNLIDSLAGETDYLDIRKRKVHYASLKAIEQVTDEATSKETQAKRKFDDEYNQAVKKAEEEINATAKKWKDGLEQLNEKKRKGEHVDPAEFQAQTVQAALSQQNASQKLDREKERLKADRDRKIQTIRRDKDLLIESVKTEFKLWAVLLPPIPPLLIAIFVFLLRQLREREGISKARLV